MRSSTTASAWRLQPRCPCWYMQGVPASKAFLMRPCGCVSGGAARMMTSTRFSFETECSEGSPDRHFWDNRSQVLHQCPFMHLHCRPCLRLQHVGLSMAAQLAWILSVWRLIGTQMRSDSIVRPRRFDPCVCITELFLTAGWTKVNSELYT